MRLVFASNNAHKLSEVRDIMPAGVEVLSLKDIGFEQEIEENGTTLEENSRIKAETVADFINDRLMNGDATLNGVNGVFADDTGLEIDALDGKPGVYTARWYLTDKRMKGLKDEREVFAANRAKALRELEGKEDRGAQFRTVITLAFASLVHVPKPCFGREYSGAPLSPEIKISGDPKFIQVEGIVRGRIAEEEYGEGGFGYDPVFIPEGYDKTFGELPAEIKNGISHRARALAELVKLLKR
jgi:XTP/dITP diphosphohydrolase